VSISSAARSQADFISDHHILIAMKSLTYPIQNHVSKHNTYTTKGFQGYPFTWVATPQDFRSLLSSLRQISEIAVDLEHHNYRSFGGFLCLMQISTREEDWIIDTLSLREEMTELNEIFTNPKIVKVGVCFRSRLD